MTDQPALAFPSTESPSAPNTAPPRATFIVAPPLVNPDLAAYKLYRSNALWFANRNDGYGYQYTHHNAEVPKGVCLKCSKEYYAECVARWQKLLFAHVVKPCLFGTANTLSASDADSRPDPECLCPACLRRELQNV